MDKLKIFILILFTNYLFFQIKSHEIKEKPMVIFTSGRNNKLIYKKNIDSILNQKYINYQVIYVDDCSDDNTGKLVQEYIRQKKAEHKFRIIINKNRNYKMHNQYNAIHNFCKDNDIIVELDADDCFAHDNVLSHLNKIYSDQEIWLTYSRFVYFPSGKIEKKWSQDIPKKILASNKIREHGFKYGGLRSYYAWLFKLIKKDDLLYKGEILEFKNKFVPRTSDASIMFPMIEMCRNGHFKFIDDILLIYNEKQEKKYNSKFSKARKETLKRLIKLPKYPAL